MPVREKKILNLFSASLFGFFHGPRQSVLPKPLGCGSCPLKWSAMELFVECDNGGLAAGEKTAEIHITPVLTEVTPLATPASPVNQSTPAVVIPVSLVLQIQAPVLGATPAVMSFSASETNPRILTQNLVVKNNGGPELGWTAVPETEHGIAWLSIFPPDGNCSHADPSLGQHGPA